MTRRWFLLTVGAAAGAAAVGRVPWPIAAPAPTAVDLHHGAERVATVTLGESTFFQTLLFDGWSVGGGPVKKFQSTCITCAWLRVDGSIIEERA